MRRLVVLLCFLAPPALFAQNQPAVIDTFKVQLAKAKTDPERIEILSYLSKVMMNVNPAEADKYGKQMLEIAEGSRDRKMMITALLANGERFSYLFSRRENIEKAIGYYNQALELARQNKLDDQIIGSYLYLSEIHRTIPDLDKALSYSNQAFSYAGLIKNDSITARVYYELGSVYFSKSEKLLALRNFLAGFRLAEELKNYPLQRSGYSRLSAFYSSLEDYDQAIDYQVDAMNTLEKIKSGQSIYNKVQDLNRIGDLYGYKKSWDMANHYYEKSLAMADSLKFEPLKAMSYRSIVNNYVAANEPQKALDYFNNHPQLKQYLQAMNFGYFIDQSYGFMYTQIGKYDSAKYYYSKVADFFAKDVNVSNQFSYNYQLGILYRKTGEYDKSLHHFTIANQLADKMGSLPQKSYVANMLDSIYQQKGDYKQALFYNTQYHTLKDSVEKLGKEKDIMQTEAADEKQRQDRITKLAEEKKRQRNNIQYLGITIGIVAFFILLVVMGMFKVSATTIKMISFFAFIMFFEFIFLIFKKNIYSLTKGEPLMDLLFMIGLAALLLPLHHWLEHKVIHYLTSHNRLTSAGHHIRRRFFKKPGTAAEKNG